MAVIEAPPVAPPADADAGPAPQTTSHPEDGHRTYHDAVASGFYQRDTGGLHGKFDNVRRYWEDQITRYMLHRFVEPLAAAKRRALARVRVVDLGSGSGEGYEILTSLRKEGRSLASKEVDVLPVDLLGQYKGVDLSPAMVEQGIASYADNPKVSFAVGNLSEGLASITGDDPYDIYFSSFGSLSHLDDDQMRRLITDLCGHMGGSCIFVVDLLGRYSYEWPCYWPDPADGRPPMRDYSMSYLHQAETRSQADIEVFPLRYWGAAEFDAFLSEIVAGCGVEVARRELRDRSILVGRHMDTREYNPAAQPLRSAVNQLHEFNVRTDWSSLIFDYMPQRGSAEVNRFLERFQVAWNSVVYAAVESLERWNDDAWLKAPVSEEGPEAVRDAVRTIRNVIRSVQWFRMGDPRANVVEPQLGYILRNLEMDMQEGLGSGHGLLGVYELRRPA